MQLKIMNLFKRIYQISGIAAVAAMLVSVTIVLWAVVTQTSVPDSPAAMHILNIAGCLFFVCTPLSFLAEAADKTLHKQPLPWLTLLNLIAVMFALGLILGMGWASSLK